MSRILALDVAGNPFRWLGIESAAHYLASNKVAWSIGEEVVRLHGGTRRDGLRSTLDIPPVIALAKSESMARHMQALPLGHDNTLLFRRDHHTCAYCGKTHGLMTREHIVPRGMGGEDIWTNVVTACRPCNMRKGCRTPEQAGMPLLYVPYAPCRYEHFILASRNILVDQMSYLTARLPRHSRLLLS